MCERCSAALDVLALEVELSETLLADGTAATGGHRDPTPDEIAAGVKFGHLETIQQRAEKAATAAALDVRTETLDALSIALADKMTLETPWDAMDALTDIVDPAGAVLEGVQPAVARATRDVREALRALVDAAADAVYDEARAQGVPEHVLPPLALPDDIDRALDAHARRVATEPVTRLAKVAADAAATAASKPDAHALDVLGDALDAAEQSSTAGLTDTVSQAVNVAHGIGRNRAAELFPTVKHVQASELLDRNTCVRCAAVDGRVYESIGEALKDYPGAGGYVGCLGGNRCRGMLVFVHATEQRPTLDGVEEHGGGKVPDVTPRGATGVTWPSHVDEYGRIIPPVPDDLRFVPPPDAPPDDLDDFLEGATEPYERPTEDDPAAGGVTVDDLEAAWADTSDDDLREAITSAEADGSDEALAYAEDARRELDLRARLNRQVAVTVVDEGDTAATVAAVHRAADARPKGRAIDRARESWELHAWDTYVRAEEATNGYLVRREVLDEFRQKGGDTYRTLFHGPASRAYYYASEELRRYWEEHPRLTFDEWAVMEGVSDRRTLDRAAKAKLARQQAAAIAEEDRDARKARQQAAAADRRRRRGPLTEGEKLAREQDRRTRLNRQQGDA